jgi:hypothetical protein
LAFVGAGSGRAWAWIRGAQQALAGAAWGRCQRAKRKVKRRKTTQNEKRREQIAASGGLVSWTVIQ